MFSLKCFFCNQIYPLSYNKFICNCGKLLDIYCNLTFSADLIHGEYNGFWRYLKMLPVSDNKQIVSFNECFTPLEKIIDHQQEIYIKHDYLLPSGSYKDRGASLMLSVIKSLGIDEIIEDSSGNAGAAVAAYAAKAGIKCNILVPESTSEAKTAQVVAYGAKLQKIRGDRDATTKYALHLAEKYYYASHIFNPLFFQGIKTLAYEICEQMNWKCPEYIITPVGNGTIVVGLYLGFKELQNSGIINSIPKIIAVQATNCSPLNYFQQKNTDKGFIKCDTIAEGIAIANPPRLKQIVAIISETKGGIVKVSEDEIKQSWQYAMRQGIFIEPTSAVVFAALNSVDLKTLSGKTVLILTGSGLKSVAKLVNKQ